VKRVMAAMYGAVAGALTALVLGAVFAGRFALTSLTVSDGRAVFEASSGAVYLLVVVIGLLGGLVIAAVTYVFGVETEPDAQRFPATWMLPIGAVVAALFSYAVLRFGVGAAGDISAGVITISTARMVVIMVVIGVVAGSITAAVVDALARPSFIGFHGEAAPASTSEMVREMIHAIGAPVIAIIVGAVFAISLSQILLAIEGTGAVVVFGVVGAVVLGGATLIALRPWDRGQRA